VLYENAAIQDSPLWYDTALSVMCTYNIHSILPAISHTCILTCILICTLTYTHSTHIHTLTHYREGKVETHVTDPPQKNSFLTDLDRMDAGEMEEEEVYG